MLYTVTIPGAEYPNVTESTAEVMRRAYGPDAQIVAQDGHTGHEVKVAVDSTARYPYRAVCTCSWTSRGYVRNHAAQTMADDHLENS